jgi:hypothetical protein
VFEGKESEAFGSALAQADARGISGLLGVLGRLPTDVLEATLSDEKVKGALTAASRWTDPAKYTATMTGLDKLYARDPHTFTDVFGKDTYHALADWQSMLRYVSPNDLAAERARIEDPGQAKVRKDTEEAGHKIAREMSPDEIVKKFDSSWIATLTGQQPRAPIDSGTLDAFLADFGNLVARRYVASRNKDTAVNEAIDLMKNNVWGRSEVNGGKLMRAAPEQVYPAINGSHDWMQPQIEEEVARRVGVPRYTASSLPSLSAVPAPLLPAAGALTAALGNRGPNWDYTLIADRQTETEAQQYRRGQPLSNTNRPPTYMLMVMDNRRVNPQWDIVRGDDGKAARVGFDPDIPRAEARVKFGIDYERNQAFLKRSNVEAARERVRQTGEPPPAEIRGPGDLSREYLGSL